MNFLIQPFFTNKRKELSKAPKTVFYDNGIRNFLINNMAPVDGRTDKGFMFETTVFNELKKNVPSGMQVQYWRTQHQTEVDFVLRYDQHKIPVEVKAGTTENAPRALMSFAASYGSKFAFVLNQDNWEVKQINDTKVYFLPHFCAGFLPKKIQSG